MIASISNYYSKFVEKENIKKYYFLDTGILGLFLVNQDSKLLENQVYIELRRRGYQVYFLKRNSEVDFYIPEYQLLIQVSYSLKEKETYDREVKGLEKAMKEFNIDNGMVITYDESDEIKSAHGIIKVIPAWIWLLEKNN